MFLYNKIIEIINYIPDHLKPAVLTSFATLTGALAGAFVAQLISHDLIRRREKKNSSRVIYQKLYAPMLLKTYFYYDVATHFRKLHDVKEGVNEKDILNEIIEHVGNNLMYAPPKIISLYHKVKRYDLLEDYSGFNSHAHTLELIEELLNDVSKIKMFDKSTKKTIREYRTLYLVWRIMTMELNSQELAADLLGYDFYFQKARLCKNRYYKELKKHFNISLLERFLKFIRLKKEKESEYSYVSGRRAFELISTILAKKSDYSTLVETYENYTTEIRPSEFGI
jgi:hypothetical protein